MSTGETSTKVRIDFERVQSWLFAVPRLRAMVGANTLLGEVLRIKLPDLAQTRRDWTLAPVAAGYPSASSDDPIQAYGYPVSDDPASDAKDGILSRDGGHFEACFETGADEFVRAATALLRRELPGLRFTVRVDNPGRVEANINPPTNVSTHLSTELPVFAPCQWTGRGVGSVEIWQGDEPAWVSLDVEKRHQTAKRAREGNANDLASLLIKKSKLAGVTRPREFKDLAGPGYLALIHADGNNVGRADQWETSRKATYYHYNRVMLRRAALDAIDATCVGVSAAPLIPLMLGGDDLLIVCRAEIALPFVVALCGALEKAQSGKTSAPDWMQRLTLGVGVVIARPTIPINRLHDVAISLADSAKRRVRGIAVDEQRSVIDWAVYTTAWMDDPEAVRRRDWVRREGGVQRVLSQRPLDVVGCGLSTLQALLCAAEKLKDAPRSQLRYLVDQLPKGRMLSELAFSELSKEARTALDKAGVKDVWKVVAGGRLLTSVLDLVEIAEIGRLGTASADSDDHGSEGAIRELADG